MAELDPVLIFGVILDQLLEHPDGVVDIVTLKVQEPGQVVPLLFRQLALALFHFDRNLHLR